MAKTKMIRKKFVGVYATILAYDEATRDTLTSMIFVNSRNPKAINKMCANFMKESFPHLRFMGVVETVETEEIREMPCDFFYENSNLVIPEDEAEDETETVEDGTAG